MQNLPRILQHFVTCANMPRLLPDILTQVNVCVCVFMRTYLSPLGNAQPFFSLSISTLPPYNGIYRASVTFSTAQCTGSSVIYPDISLQLNLLKKTFQYAPLLTYTSIQILFWPKTTP